MAVQEQDIVEPQPEPQAITVRAVLIGLVLVIALGITATYVRYYIHGSRVSISHVPMGMLMPFMVMLFGFAIIGRLTQFVLKPGEWHVILAMGLAGAMLPVTGITGYMIGYISAPYFAVTDGNGWEKFIHPHMPKWLVPENTNDSITWFYQGMPVGADIPWDVWMVPLFWWFMAVMAGFTVMSCVAVIFRKQWAENERLLFPVVTPLVEMVANPGDGNGWLPAFTRNRLFWVGFTLAFGAIAWNCISYFFPGFPQFPIYRGRWVWIDRQFPPIRGYLGIFTLFFSYFASLEILFSLWFFDLLFVLEGGWLNKLGYKAISPYEPRGVYKWQMYGGFVVMVASMFWVARRHLRDVFLKATGQDDTIEDSGELLSYRGALIGIVLGLGFLFVWMMQMNFDPIPALCLLVMFIFCYVGLAKILADTGLPYIGIPAGPWTLILPFFGNGNISAVTHVAERFAALGVGGWTGRMLPAMTHIGRIAEGIPAKQRRNLMGAVALAIVVSFVFSVYITIRLGYLEGAYTFGAFEIPSASARHYKHAVEILKKYPDRPPFFMKEPAELAFFLIGGGIMTALIFLRHRFVWWPLHPVGLAVSGTHLLRHISFTIFLTWLLKLVVMKIGGPSVYRKSQPLFIGLLVGYVLGVVFSTLLDVIWFPEQGHRVHMKG
ncbi:MAG: hypothetical protein HOE48_20045 [Candidatus Latescibacteria bacterium]|jgi:hypothetical protein|nr:hypothetical protein [Candidatus Latescibacterota bacterium]